MAAKDELVVRVLRDWNGFRTAEVRCADLQNVHWFQPLGAPRPILHGYVSCARIVRGTIPHECSGANGPHVLLVCILKRHTLPSIYLELAQRANGAAIACDAR